MQALLRHPSAREQPRARRRELFTSGSPGCHPFDGEPAKAARTLLVMTSPDAPNVAVAVPGTTEPAPNREPAVSPVFTVDDVNVSYHGVPAISGVTFEVTANAVTALIGPSGCGKSTLLRSFNRMNDLIIGAEVEGRIAYHGADLYAAGVDPVEVRRRIGMVFQKPNPFPKSIYDNVAFGPRLRRNRRGLDEVVERALTRAALWDEVKDKLKESAFALSGGQQQRLCIARCLAVEPDVLLMDEPCSALDPIATARIEDLMDELKRDVTILIVTHNMQQAARTSEMTAFITTDVGEDGSRVGRLVEYDETGTIFTTPADSRTEGYVTGRFG